MMNSRQRSTPSEVRRFLSVFLAIILCMSLFPAGSRAAGGDTETPEVDIIPVGGDSRESISVRVTDLGDLPVWIGRDCASLRFTIRADCGTTGLAGSLGVRLWDAEPVQEWGEELTLKKLVSTGADVISREE